MSKKELFFVFIFFILPIIMGWGSGFDHDYVRCC